MARWKQRGPLLFRDKENDTNAYLEGIALETPSRPDLCQGRIAGDSLDCKSAKRAIGRIIQLHGESYCKYVEEIVLMLCHKLCSGHLAKQYKQYKQLQQYIPDDLRAN